MDIAHARMMPLYETGRAFELECKKFISDYRILKKGDCFFGGAPDNTVMG